MLREMSIVACSVYMLLPVVCFFLFLLCSLGTGRVSSPVRARARQPDPGSTIAPIDHERPCVALSISNLPIGPDSRLRICLQGPSGCLEVEQTVNQLLQRTMQLIASTIEFPLDYPIPRTPLSAVPVNRSVFPRDMLRYRLVVLIVARIYSDLRGSRLSAITAMSIPSRRPVCYCKETTGIGRLLQCCCSCNVREQTACTVISGMLFRVSPSMRMRPGGEGIS
ncbi:hypothetical protein P5V15_015271 [Pogonomyrmex californicus]